MDFQRLVGRSTLYNQRSLSFRLNIQPGNACDFLPLV
jgi:hypothetical protein